MEREPLTELIELLVRKGLEDLAQAVYVRVTAGSSPDPCHEPIPTAAAQS